MLTTLSMSFPCSARISSPLGDLFAVAYDGELVALDFCDNPEQTKKLSKIASRYGAISSLSNDVIFVTLQGELDQYFSGERKYFTIVLAPLSGTPFQIDAWGALSRTSYGETINYAQQAASIGRPKAVRAIGGANHVNPIVIIIPCHRVIGKSGKLVGYGGGIDRKRALLEHEKQYLEACDSEKSVFM